MTIIGKVTLSDNQLKRMEADAKHFQLIPADYMLEDIARLYSEDMYNDGKRAIMNAFTKSERISEHLKVGVVTK